MTIKLYRADGELELFRTDNYVLGKAKDFHPLICKAEVFTDAGKLLARRSRRFSWYYKHVTFKTKEVQDKIEELKRQTVVNEQ